MLAQPPPSDLLLIHAPKWVQALLGVLGGWGLFVIAFLDSSFFTLPILNDLLVIVFSVHRPELMPFYASMTSLGSILGCLVIFYLAHKGGEVVLRKKASAERIARIQGWFERNEFLAVAIPAVLPPPTPFKLFVLAAGVFQVRLRYFLTALTLGRGLRYFLLGFLAVSFREKSLTYLAYAQKNPLQVSGAVIALMLFGYLIVRLVQRYGPRRPAQPGGEPTAS